MAAWLPNYSAPSVSLCGVDCGLLSPNRNYNGNFKEFNPLSPGSPLQSWDILSTPHHRLTIRTPGSTNTTFIGQMAVFCKYDKIVIEPFKFAYLGGRKGGRGRILMDQNKIFINQAASQAKFTPACPEEIFLCKCYAGAELKCCQLEITKYNKI